MRRPAAIVAALIWCLSLLLRAGQMQQPAAPPVFRADVDLIQIDVSVLDKNRKPVRKLAAADFTVLEDGVERPVAAFAEVVLPPRSAATPNWIRDSSPDVTSNRLPDEGRLVLIVMDRTIGVGVPALTATRIALAAIDGLGPGDEAAVVHTGPGPAQNFTTDRARLRRAVSTQSPNGDPSSIAADIEQMQLQATLDETGVEMSAITNTGSCYCGLCVPETITRAAEALRDVPRRRKTLLFIGSQVVLQARVSPAGIGARDSSAIDSVTECGFRLDQARERMMRALDVSNMTIHSIDPTGLSTVSPNASASTPIRGRAATMGVPMQLAENNFQQSTLQVLPDYTGGRTVLNTNVPEADVQDILNESATYYLVAFKPAQPAPDGTYHRIDVKVRGRGLEVHARRSYVASMPPAAPARATPLRAGEANVMSPALRSAITPVIPRRDVVVEIAAAPFASRGPTGGEVVVTLGVDQGSEQTAPTSTVNVLTEAFNDNGRAVVSHHQSVGVTRARGADSPGRFEVFSRLPLKPGRYEIRAAVEDPSTGKTGSVYTFVEVPNFSRAPLALSGVALSSVPAAASAATKMDDLIPVMPTTRRQFSRSDRATVFAWLYQGAGALPQTVNVVARVRGASNRVVFERATTIGPSAFNTSGSAEYRLDLPLMDLPAGDYLLAIEASRGRDTTRRDVQFGVR